MTSSSSCDYIVIELKPEPRSPEGIDRWASKVKIELLDGRVLECEHDVSKPATDLDAQWQRLCAKFNSLVVPVIGAERAKTIVDQIATLEQRENISELMNAAR